ncbi:MAG: glycosyltransferase family 2 protein [Planctomycetota bacterium]
MNTPQPVPLSAPGSSARPSPGLARPVVVSADGKLTRGEVGSTAAPEVSVVMPCLNEADTLAACIRKAWAGLQEAGVRGEVIVADNGSDDGSQAIARAEGARVVAVTQRGYGAALMGGIEAAQGDFVVMGDADESYDFGEIPALVARWKRGADVVQGCRLPAGGGRVAPGAMPVLHRWIGNPMFTRLARLWFQAPIHDIYCGLRGFTKTAYRRMALRSVGMEFATEMIIKASALGMRIDETPITLHPDGRKAHAPHLKTFRDGWRTLRFFLVMTPRWLFLAPSMVLLAAGAAGYALVFSGVAIGPARFDAHTLVVSSLLALCGMHALWTALAAKTFAVREGLAPPHAGIERLFRWLKLERALVASAVVGLAGVGLIAVAAGRWAQAGFGALDYGATMRLVVPGATMALAAFQSAMSSFFVSLLGMSRRPALLAGPGAPVGAIQPAESQRAAA